LGDSVELEQMISSAIATHGAWKERLATAIKQGRSEFSIDLVAKDDQCSFGSWMYSNIDPSAKLSEHYVKVRAIHASFHRAAAAVLALAVSGKSTDATKAIGPASEFDNASSRMTDALGAWRSSLR
jgi:hypothetical protein